ncbi:hypothetical protein ILUMI_19565 [Ignelater luminosus]|uniref:Uncharacterized protein n=1 Tax=Ignelater luminosus TaxID=2038154 RepID=A0A8K0CJX0_IGNLU|nr:hypothetical protein ILUMI_19565 [Ignelater luminosus]
MTLKETTNKISPQAQLSSGFTSNSGVQQEDPLSTIVFNIIFQHRNDRKEQKGKPLKTWWQNVEEDIKEYNIHEWENIATNRKVLKLRVEAIADLYMTLSDFRPGNSPKRLHHQIGMRVITRFLYDMGNEITRKRYTYAVLAVFPLWVKCFYPIPFLENDMDKCKIVDAPPLALGVN